MNLIDFKSSCMIYKQIFISFCLFLLVLSSCSSKPKENVISSVDSTLRKTNIKEERRECGCMRGNFNFNKDSLFTQVEINPEPPGGMKVFREWIQQNYIMPQKAFDNKVKGNVMISFIVQKNGELTDFKIEIDKGYGTGGVGVEMLKKSKKWKPGIHFGAPVKTRYVLPIRLDLEKMQVENNDKVR